MYFVKIDPFHHSRHGWTITEANLRAINLSIDASISMPEEFIGPHGNR
jgi:hypothetical protein